MIYILVPLLAVLAVLRNFLPMRWGVHAARANKDIGSSRFVSAGWIVDERGRHVSLTGKFLGKVEGDSMADCGLSNGDTFIAQVLTEEHQRNLQVGDVVVVDDVHAHSNSGLRLRCVTGVNSNGCISFASHTDGKRHRDRSDEKVKARVEYVVA